MSDEWLKKVDADIIFCGIRIWLGPDKRQGAIDAMRLLKVYERTVLNKEADTKPASLPANKTSSTG